ncbi:arginine--tRNA ligase [Guptibacillus hwajinpoensis]|uniref:Arginine--tRNA ligase n=1 Tax=Guptibacillus hwajinpoensis TaxID=208199 RepID=A0A0J6CIV9_9BACL|nr:arginine--tRNA ligase [Alkalihalobacillus macyae]KMM36141.1 arginine--tRNA ligase [Alkalihalobacillus macyae]
MKYINLFAQELYAACDEKLGKEEIVQRIEKPKHEELGDYAFPCFDLARMKRETPKRIAANIASRIHSAHFEKVEAVGPYINVFLKKETVAYEVVRKILQEGNHYGTSNLGKGGAVTIDLSSPNIAKPFSMGHLRSTVIGNALALILEKSGYRPVRINHLGDWGTQFGKLITAYRKWGNEAQVRQNTIKELLALYIKFHEEADLTPSLLDDGRKAFKSLEEGDPDAVALWKWFREESLQEFNRIYQLMGITFDSTNGEAFYNDKMQCVVELLEEKELLTESQGAMVVEVDDHLPPCLIKKKDGATLYATRDLAAALYRYETYGFNQALYVVGNEQSLHFKQVFKVLKKMGYEWADQMHHITFGMMLKDGKKMSTRKGKVVLLEEVLKEAIALAKENINTKNPLLKNKQIIAEQIGVGAVMFHDLKNDRRNDIDFSLEDMLRVEGETGPYVQYTNARACSILRKGQFQSEKNSSIIVDKEAWPIITRLNEFPMAVDRAVKEYDPSQVAKYVLDLSRSFNKYYGQTRILDDKTHMNARLKLVSAVSIVLTEGLRLLGLHAPEEM